MNKIKLIDQNLTELTEEDLIALCHLSNYEPEELVNLSLDNNKLTNIDFIQSNTPFINLKELRIIDNQITDINNIKYLKNLEQLDISFLKFNNEKETVELLKTIKSLKKIWCYKTFDTYTYKYLQKELSNIEIN